MTTQKEKYENWIEDYYKRIQKIDKELAESFKKKMADRIYQDEPENQRPISQGRINIA